VRGRTWTVSALLREVNTLLGQGFAGLRIEGEVTNVSRSGRGHLYFTLKDADAQLDCAMWSRQATRLRFDLEDGLAVRATGSLTIYERRGRFQMVVDELEPEGLGALQLAFEQLKRRLELEGLFDPQRKRPLPSLPQRIGLVTSATGAAIRDMLAVLGRFPLLDVVVAPVRVQGDGAAVEIARAVDRLGASDLVDVVVVARGGGSLEDLWAFNEEVVARAIAACPVPVVSGVGHEVDFTIADFVADIRAATPTHAAEILVARLEDSAWRLEEAGRRLGRGLQRHLDLARARLRGLEGSAGLYRLPSRIRVLRTRLDQALRLPSLLSRLSDRSRSRLAAAESGLRRLPSRIAAGGHRRLLASRRQQLEQLMKGRTDRRGRTLAAAERALTHLSPRQVLQRGYSITSLEDDRGPLRDAAGVASGATLVTTLAHGELRSLVVPRSRRPASRKRPVTEQPDLFDGMNDSSEER
jgi:exodeoxyribonuclease VII large subunit